MKILVAVIAFNEEKNIDLVINDLIVHNKYNYDIVVIDNGSNDNTRNIAEEKGITVLSHPINSGHSGGTAITYFNYAFYNNYDLLIQFDGDGQHVAAEIGKIVEVFSKSNCDYIIGSRFLDKNGFQSSFIRRIGINMFSVISSYIIKNRVTDATSGFRGYSRLIMEVFSKKFQHEINDQMQVLMISYYAGAKISEVPVKMTVRLHGKSEFTFLPSISFVLNGLMNLFGILLQKKTIKKYF